MKRHLYRERICSNENNLDLTDEIREMVLNHHKYYPPKTETPINQLQSKQVLATTDINQDIPEPNNAQITGRTTQNVVSFQEPDINTINGINPLIKQSACGKNVWVLYAKYDGNRSPIRVIIENGCRKMHLFDFISALTGCTTKDILNEWAEIIKSLAILENSHILTKIRTSKIRFPELEEPRLSTDDSMVIDIYQATKVALAIGRKANWLTEILVSHGNRFMNRDLPKPDDLEYMYIAQSLIDEYEPDDFLRLWAEEFLVNTLEAREQQAISKSENITTSITPTVSAVIEESNIIQETARVRARVRTKGRRSQSARPYRSRSRARERSVNLNIIGCLYMYELILVYETREESISYLKSINVNIDNLDCSVIICKNDLGGRKLVKIGKTELCSMGRQVDYINGLCQLYDLDLTARVQYDINFIARLGDIEDEVKTKLFTADRVGLVKSDGQISRPNEVFKVDCLDKTHCEIETVIGEFQSGTHFNPFLTEPNKSDETKLREMEETTKQMEETTKQMEETTKQMEETTKQMEETTKQMELRTRILEILDKRGVSSEQIEKILMSL